MGRRASSAWTVALAVALVAGSARAQDAPAPAGEPTTAGEDAPVITIRGRDQRRPMPDYDGLDGPPPSPEEIVIWIPRVLLSPFWFVSEVLVRQPLGALLTWLERERVPDLLIDFFTWDARRAGVVPTAFYDFGLSPSAGLYFFWNDLGAPGHQVRVHLGSGGVDRLRGTALDRVVLAPGVELALRIDALLAPDRPYQGIGPSTLTRDRTRYRHGRVDGRVELALRPWRRSSVIASIGVSGNQFDPDGYVTIGDSEPSLASAIASGRFGQVPPGFEGYVAYRQVLRVTVDTREEPPRPGHGVRVDAMVEQAFDVTAPVASRWLRTSLTASGYVDAGAERVLSLHVRTVFADPLGTSPVPLVEQAQLGDQVLALPGFLGGALVDRSSLVTTLRYRWPVWFLLDASLFVGVGNVFGEHLSDLAIERMRLSWGLGLQTLGDRDAGVRVTVAFGTRTFEQGGDLDSVRVAFGGAMGF